MLARTKRRTIDDSSRPLIMIMAMEGVSVFDLKRFVKASRQRRWNMCVGDESRLPFPATN